jgi:hypothetical protein
MLSDSLTKGHDDAESPCAEVWAQGHEGSFHRHGGDGANHWGRGSWGSDWPSLDVDLVKLSLATMALLALWSIDVVDDQHEMEGQHEVVSFSWNADDRRRNYVGYTGYHADYIGDRADYIGDNVYDIGSYEDHRFACWRVRPLRSGMQRTSTRYFEEGASSLHFLRGAAAALNRRAMRYGRAVSLSGTMSRWKSD